MSNRANLICLIIILLCAALCASLYFGDKILEELKVDYKNLTNEYNSLDKETTDMTQRIKAFNDAFSELDKLKVGVGENVDFYDEAQLAISRGGARVLSNSPNAPRDGRISMKMSFIGDYYSIIKAFAELRGLPNVVRVISVSMSSTNPDTSVNSEIKADVVLEALAYSSR